MLDRIKNLSDIDLNILFIDFSVWKYKTGVLQKYGLVFYQECHAKYNTDLNKLFELIILELADRLRRNIY